MDGREHLYTGMEEVYDVKKGVFERDGIGGWTSSTTTVCSACSNRAMKDRPQMILLAHIEKVLFGTWIQSLDVMETRSWQTCW